MPDVINGYQAFAPEYADGGGGYDVSLFADLAPLESASFWFTSRNELIEWALAKYCVGFESFLEIGCGTGFVLSGVAHHHPDTRLVGSEIFVDGLPFANSRVPSAELMQMDARKIPFEGEFDVIGAFDVLEHIEEDHEVLREVQRALVPRGTLLITVPQHRWLWSAADDHAHHARRYTSRELRTKLSQAGFDIVRSTSFVSLLLPAMIAARIKELATTSAYDPTAELKLPARVNSFFCRLMRVEFRAINRGITFPMGGSRLVVARKR